MREVQMCSISLLAHPCVFDAEVRPECLVHGNDYPCDVNPESVDSGSGSA